MLSQKYTMKKPRLHSRLRHYEHRHTTKTSEEHNGIQSLIANIRRQ